jgi:hypothetical protein
MGDGAYDGEPVSQAVLDKQPDAQMIIPPHKTAVVSNAGNTQRDQHIQTIAQQGRIAWQKKNGSMDQCVCTQQNDKSGHACVRKNLTNARNEEL